MAETNEDIIVFDNIVRRVKVIGGEDRFENLEAVEPKFCTSNAKGDLRAIKELKEVGDMGTASGEKFKSLFDTK